MTTVTAELQVPPLLKGGEVIKCPVCGQYDDLTLLVVVADFSEDPATLRCDDMHEWVEPRVPRRIGAEVFAIREREIPEMHDWSDVPRSVRRQVARKSRRRRA
ncbi:hypothetical protein [Streptomyces fagopyri]